MSGADPREAARRLSGFVWQSLAGRGLRCERADVLLALQELTAAQLSEVHRASQALARGSDARETVALMTSLRQVSAASTRQALAGAGLVYRADLLLPLAASEAQGLNSLLAIYTYLLNTERHG